MPYTWKQLPHCPSWFLRSRNQMWIHRPNLRSVWPGYLLMPSRLHTSDYETHCRVTSREPFPNTCWSPAKIPHGSETVSQYRCRDFSRPAQIGSHKGKSVPCDPGDFDLPNGSYQILSIANRQSPQGTVRILVWWESPICHNQWIGFEAAFGLCDSCSFLLLWKGLLINSKE